MPGTFFGLEIARRGLKVHQQALDITGHNLANASTPGYSRQEAVIRVTDPYTNPGLNSPVTPGQFGSGVEVDKIRRIKDEYLDNGVRQAITDNGYWKDQVFFMQQAEAFFAEPANEGIGNRITDFFKAWMNLNNNPDNPGAKAVVVELGRELANMMSSTYRQLDNVEKSIATAVSDGATPPNYSISGKLDDQVNRINEILESVKSLTERIKKVYALNQQPNDLLDQRDVLLEELSGYVPVTVKFGYTNGKPDGSINELKIFNITVDLDNFDKGDPGNRFNLVSSDADATEITLQLGSGGAGNEISLTDNYSTVQQGSLMGLEKARKDLIGFKGDLDLLAKELNSQIGEVEEDDPDPNSIDFPFFTGSLSDNDFNVRSELNETPNRIYGPRATRISGLWDDRIDNLGNTTFEEYYSSLVTKVGNSAKSADNMASTNSAIARQVTALRDSVSGVSVDEELTRMVQFQYGFQASARVINTLDGMLDVIINRLF